MGVVDTERELSTTNCAAALLVTFSSYAAPFDLFPKGQTVSLRNPHPMTFDIERYLNIRSAHSGTFGPDGERLAFLMDTTGTDQVWTLDAPGEWPVQRTFYDERLTFVDYSPKRQELAFGKDQGGDERAQLFTLNVDTGEVTNRTRRPDAKHRWMGWDSEGERFAFASNRRDNSVFDLYVQNRDAAGSAAERVHKSNSPLVPVAWAPSDDRLLFQEPRSSYNHDLHVLDLDSGSVRQVTPEAGEAAYRSAQWAPDGESLYLATDRDSDTLQLERVELETGEFTVVEKGGGWGVREVAVHEETSRVVYMRDVDGYADLTAGQLVEPDRIEPVETPTFPDGFAHGIEFASDGQRYAATVTASTDNTNVYVFDMSSGEGQRWTYSPTAGIPRHTFVEPQLIHYPTFDGLDIPAFFSLPDEIDEDADDEVPVIVDIHGGPEGQRVAQFRPVKQYFLNNGYAVFEPNVRGSAGYGRAYASLDDVRNRMDSVKDLRAGVEWLHNHPSVDSDRVVAYGISYGGFMVLAGLTEYPDLWAAGVDIAGLANFVTFLENTGDWRRELRAAEYGSLDKDREFLEEISPVNNISNIEAPLLVLHGENDPRVPVSEAEQIAEEAAEHVPVEKLVFPDEGHGIAKLENRIEAYRTTVEFLDEYV